MIRKTIPSGSCSFRIITGALFVAWLTVGCNVPLAGKSASPEPTHETLATKQQALESGSNQSQDDEGQDLQIPLYCPKAKQGGYADYYLCVNHKWSGYVLEGSFTVQLDPQSSNAIRFLLENKGSGSSAWEDFLSPNEITFLESGQVGPCVASGRVTLTVSIIDGTCKDEPVGVLYLTLKDEWKTGPLTMECPDASPIVVGTTTEPSHFRSGVSYTKHFFLQAGGDTVHDEAGLAPWSMVEMFWTVIAADDPGLGQSSCRIK